MFAELVRRYRRRLGLTQEDLAERTGLSVRAIGNIESDRIFEPRPATIRLLADAFGLTEAERDRFCQIAMGETVDLPAAGRGPAQLPLDVSAFTGREEQLAWLDAWFADTPGRPPAVVMISAIAGTAGVGKTALAVRWAHRVADRFPDGQLYANLRGYDPDRPLTADEVLAGFLSALGVPSRDIPAELDERAARYRTELAGSRVLIVLDNAATAEQIRPLLPGTPSCLVVVTSRDSLAGLVVVDGAHRLDLDVLPAGEAITLLRMLIGGRVDAEPCAAATLAEQCARLPLALRLVAELAASRPGASLTELVTELADQQQRLELLAAGGDARADVTAVFSWSVRHLPRDTARAFRLLGLHPGPEFDAYAVAALAGIGLEDAQCDLDRLNRAHLVHPTGRDRYSMHDLLRAYATCQMIERTPVACGQAASGRLFDYYLATAAGAMDQLHPAESHRRPRISPAGSPAPGLADHRTARAWLDTELPTLVAVAARAAAHGAPGHVILLSPTLYHYLDGHYPEALAIHGHALRAARQTGDQVGQAQALLGLGNTRMRLCQYRSASDHLNQAMVLFRQAGDPIGWARALGCLGFVERQVGRHQAAADYLSRAAAVFQQAGDHIGVAHVLNALGTLKRRMGRHEAAAGYLIQAVALFRQAGDQSGQADALSNLAIVEERMSECAAAAEHLEQALVLYRQFGNLRGEAHALDNLGILHIHLHEPDRATECLRRALFLFREVGDRDGETWVLNGLGEAAHAAGHPEDASAHHRDAYAVAVVTGDREQQARAHVGLGRAHHVLGSPTHAGEHYAQALAIYADLGSSDATDVRRRLASLSEPTDGRDRVEPDHVPGR